VGDEHDRVIVRADGNVALVRRVWQADARMVYVTDEPTIRKLEAGEDGPLAIGFPREDVFRYDPEAERRIGRPGWSWSSLSRYAPQ
jgi:hypothetical protein